MSVFKRWNGTSWEVIGPQISSTRFDDISHMITPEYSSTSTYNVDDYVVQNDKLYKCIRAIESAEEWTPAHWTQISISGEVSDLNSALNNITEYTNSLKKIEVIDYIEGYYVPNTGATCDPTSITEAADRKCAVVDCEVGDVFTINAMSDSVTFNCISVIDANNNSLLRYGGKGSNLSDRLTFIPSGGKKLIINTLITDERKSYKGDCLPASYYSELKQTIDKSEIVSGYANFGTLGVIGFSANENYIATKPHFAKKGSKITVKQGINCYYLGLMAYDVIDSKVVSNTHSGSFNSDGTCTYLFATDVVYTIQFQNSSKTTITTEDYDATVEYFFDFSEDYNELQTGFDQFSGYRGNEWISGWYQGNNGTYATSQDNSWACTLDYIDDNVIEIEAPSDMLILPGLYTDKMTYIGAFCINGVSGVYKNTFNTAYLSNVFNAKKAKEAFPDAKYIKISVTYSTNVDSSSSEVIAINPEEIPNIVKFKRRTISEISYDAIPVEYNNELIATIKTVKELNMEPCAMFLRFTDSHIWATGNNALPGSFFKAINIFKALKQSLPIEFIVDTGDDIDGSSSTVWYDTNRIDKLNDAVLSVGLPFYKVPGNHDVLHNHALDYQGIYHYFSGMAQPVYRNLATNGTDYYFDNQYLKIRYIFMNTTSESATYAFPDALKSWLETEALNTPNGFQIVLFAHIDPTSGHNITSSGIATSAAVADLITQYEDGDKHVIAYIYGHSHQDGLFANNYASIASGCMKCGTSNTWGDIDAFWTRPERTIETDTEQLFDIFIVKPISHKIHCIRFGAGVNREIHYIAETVSVSGQITLTPDITATSWQSQNTSIAAVNNGVVTGVSAGTIGIKAIDNDGNVEFWRVTVS